MNQFHNLRINETVIVYIAIFYKSRKYLLLLKVYVVGLEINFLSLQL